MVNENGRQKGRLKENVEKLRKLWKTIETEGNHWKNREVKHGKIERWEKQWENVGRTYLGRVEVFTQFLIMCFILGVFAASVLRFH